MKHVAMLGEGAWGSAVATVLAHNSVTVKLWCHDASMPADIVSMRCNNRYLPTVELSAYIQPSADMRDIIADVTDIFIAIPVQHLRSVLEQLQTFSTPAHRYILLCKGIERDSCLLPTQIVKQIMGDRVTTAVIAGPSFARDVARKQLTGVVVACENSEFAYEVQALVSNDFFKTTYSSDVVGVQLGAALKNVVALMAGMLQGAGYSANTQAFLVTRMFHEMTILAEIVGVQSVTTLYGLSGFGDTVLTVYGGLSKNMFVGQQLGAGKSLEAIIKETGYIPEGVNTVHALLELCGDYRHKVPLLMATGDVINQKKTIRDVLALL